MHRPVMRAAKVQGQSARKRDRSGESAAPIALAVALAGAVTLLAATGLVGAALLAAASFIDGETALVVITAKDRPGDLAYARNLLQGSPATATIRQVDVATEFQEMVGISPPGALGAPPMLKARLRGGPAHTRLIAGLRRLPRIRIDDSSEEGARPAVSAAMLRRLGAALWLLGGTGGVVVGATAARLAVAARDQAIAKLEALGAPRPQAVRIALLPLARSGATGLAAGIIPPLLMLLAAGPWLHRLGFDWNVWIPLVAAPLLVGLGAGAGWAAPYALIRPGWGQP